MKKTRSFFSTLSFRISFFIILIMVASLLVFSLVFIISERNKVKSDIVKSGEIFANFSNKIIYDNYVQFYTHPSVEDFSTFTKNIQGILKNNTDVVGVSLLGKNGRILFDSDEFKVGKYSGPGRTVSDEETLRMLGSEDVMSRTVSESSGKEETEIMIPLAEQAGGHLFSMQYLISNQSVVARMREVYIQILSVVIPLTILVVGAAIVFTLQLVRPIIQLTGVVEKLQEGNMEARSDNISRDEIGTLAGVFNQMAIKLGGYYKELERQVKDRTAELDKKIDELGRMNKLMIDRELKMVELKKRIEELEK